MRKVLLVRPTLGQGGADRVTVVLMQNLDPGKYDVTLLLMRKEGPHLDSVPPHVRVIDSGTRSLWFFLPAILFAIRDIRPDVVFSTCGGANIPLSLVAVLYPFRKWRIVLSERNVLFPPGKSTIKRSLMLLAKFVFYRAADVLTAVSEGVKSDMTRKLFLKPSRIRVVDNPVVDGTLLAQAGDNVDHPWFASGEPPVILHAGRFVVQKDHASLLRAFAIVRKSLPCRLFLLGDGPLLDHVKQQAVDLGVQEDVCFAGFDPNPFKYMRRCDVFVLSSLHEGMPGVLIQAMACGAPSVSTRCPFGPEEVIGNSGENGLLVPVADSQALAEAIRQVLKDPLLRERLREQGPKSVKRFTVQEAMISYLEVIE